MILTSIIFLIDGLQKFYTTDKVGLSGKHHQVDGVKIFLAAKAPGKIGFRIYRGIKPVAQGTKKTKAAFCQPAGNPQRFFDEYLNIDLISKGIKLAGGKIAIGHLRLPDRAWVSS